MDWEGDVRSECLGVCRGKMWIKELSVQHEQSVNWFYYMNHPLHKCSLIEDHCESWCFLGPDWLTWASKEKAFPGALVLLCWKKKNNIVHFLLQKKSGKKKEEKESLYIVCYISMHILYTVFHTFPKVLTRRIWLTVRS